MAQGQHLGQILLVHGLFGKHTARHLIPLQSIKGSGGLPVPYGVDHNQYICIGHNAHQPHSQYTAVHQLYIVGELEIAVKAFDHPNAYTFIREQNITNPQDGDALA
jgi:hypothetical protein